MPLWMTTVSRYKGFNYSKQVKAYKRLLMALAGSAPMSQRSGDWGRGVLLSFRSIVMGAGTKAKTVTSFLIILSVLGGAVFGEIPVPCICIKCLWKRYFNNIHNHHPVCVFQRSA